MNTRQGLKRPFQRKLCKCSLRKIYCKWLCNRTQTGTGQDQVKEMQTLQEQNKLLVEIANSQSKDTYIKVSDSGVVMNFQRTVLTPQENGTLKTTTLTQQFVNVTLRKLKRSGTKNTKHCDKTCVWGKR